MKKKIVFILIALFIQSKILAQPSKDTSAPYLKQTGIPSFKILLADSSNNFDKTNLPLDKIICLIYFNPDCDHCQKEAEHLNEKMDSLTNMFFVWVGPFYSNAVDIEVFAKKYGFKNYQNIVIGKELQYFMPVYFRMETTPYAAIYKENSLLVECRNGFSMRDFIAINDNNFIKPVYEDFKPEKKKKSKKN